MDFRTEFDTRAIFQSASDVGTQSRWLVQCSSYLSFSLIFPPPLSRCQLSGHKPIFVNEPKLSDFKLHLLKAGFTAEFSGGVLIVNNTIAVKRNAAGKVTMEGMVSTDYYRVRELLYGQYAIIWMFSSFLQFRGGLIGVFSFLLLIPF